MGKPLNYLPWVYKEPWRTSLKGSGRWSNENLPGSLLRLCKEFRRYPKENQLQTSSNSFKSTLKGLPRIYQGYTKTLKSISDIIRKIVKEEPPNNPQGVYNESWRICKKAQGRSFQRISQEPTKNPEDTQKGTNPKSSKSLESTLKSLPRIYQESTKALKNILDVIQNIVKEEPPNNPQGVYNESWRIYLSKTYKESGRNYQPQKFRKSLASTSRSLPRTYQNLRDTNNLGDNQMRTGSLSRF